MQKKPALIIFLACLLLICIALVVNMSSRGPSEDQTQSVDRNGSVETSVSVEHADSTHDVILTTHKVWLHGGEQGTLVHRDTIPTLDSLTTDAENGEGDTKSVRVKKDYQIFITVK